MSGDVSGGRFPLTGDLTLTRMGYGAMQLAGPGVWGPPRDRGAAIRVLRTVVELGLTHIDTAGFYGPDTVHDLIPGRAASLPEPPAHRHEGRLSPYPRPVLAQGAFPR